MKNILAITVKSLHPLPMQRGMLALLTGALCTFGPPISAQDSVATVPEGYVTVDIAAGTGANRVISVFSLAVMAPLGDITGQGTARITGVSTDSFTVAGAGWASNQLSTSMPSVIKITSGAAEGRIFAIGSNTTDTLTVANQESVETPDLTALGISVGATTGDTFQLYGADTLLSTLGDPGTTGVLGGADVNSGDLVRLFVDGSWKNFYYNSTASEWRLGGLETPSDNVLVRPDTAIIYARLADTPISLTVMGIVPATDRNSTVKNSGTTFLSWGFPVDTTLASSNIDSIPGWQSNTDANQADFVRMFVDGSWKNYYHNDTEWLLVGFDTPSDTVVIPASGAIVVSKKGSSAGYTTYTKTIPYNLAADQE